LIIRLREELSKEGLDAGAEAIAAHPARETSVCGGRLAVPATSTIWRILSRRGFARPQPQKRPRSSWKTCCATGPQRRWQADVTHWQLADGTDVEMVLAASNLPPPFASLPRSAAETTETLWRWR
jgi:hypothetical protein